MWKLIITLFLNDGSELSRLDADEFRAAFEARSIEVQIGTFVDERECERTAWQWHPHHTYSVEDLDGDYDPRYEVWFAGCARVSAD